MSEDDKKFTPRNAAKKAVNFLVYVKTSQLTKNAITDHTQFEEDDNIVKLAGMMVSWYVAEKLEPVTDKIVDVTADQAVALYNRRQQKQKKTAEEAV